MPQCCTMAVSARQLQSPCARFLPLRNATHKVRNCINKCSAHSLIKTHFHLEENRFFDDRTESPCNQSSALNCAPMVCAQRLGSTFLQSPTEAQAASLLSPAAKGTGMAPQESEHMSDRAVGTSRRDSISPSSPALANTWSPT